MKRTSMYKVLATTAILGQTLVGPVLSHADTVSTNTETHSPQQNQYENKLGNLPFINFASEEVDFKDHPKEAKDWIEGKVKEQEKKLSSSDTQALQDFMKKDKEEINDYLYKNKGELVDKDPLNSKIEKLDKMILDHGKTDTSMKVYLTVSNMQKENIEQSKGTILSMPNYGISSLTSITGSDAIVEAEVPKGSYAIFGESNGSGVVITERGTGLLVTDVRQIADKGILRTKIEAKLISSKEIRKINENKQKDTDTLNKQLGLQGELIQFDTKKADWKNEYTEAQKMTTNISKIDPTILGKLVEKGMHIKLVDYPITETNEYAYLKDQIPRGWEGTTVAGGKQLTWNDVPGVGSVDGKPVVARIGYSEFGKGHDTANLELHETAHAIDRVVFHNISQTDWFKKPFDLEQNSFLPTDYFK
ncbi:hypothetical protein BK708_07515, partial [Bacillus thuringiensis serovar yunnanensis]